MDFFLSHVACAAHHSSSCTRPSRRRRLCSAASALNRQTWLSFETRRLSQLRMARIESASTDQADDITSIANQQGVLPQVAASLVLVQQHSCCRDPSKCCPSDTAESLVPAYSSWSTTSCPFSRCCCSLRSLSFLASHHLVIVVPAAVTAAPSAASCKLAVLKSRLDVPCCSTSLVAI